MRQPHDVDPTELDKTVAAHPQPFEASIPPALWTAVERHQANLAQLVQSLRQAGIGPREVEAAVTIVIDSYKCELLEAIRTLAGDRPAQGSD
jgi:hypothetical protein